MYQDVRRPKRRLDKPYQCPICGGWFRTVQGLSGHNRFRHEDEQAKLFNFVSALELI